MKKKTTAFPTRAINAVKRAQDRLSELLEDGDAGNDEVRDASISLCDYLNDLWVDEEKK